MLCACNHIPLFWAPAQCQTKPQWLLQPSHQDSLLHRWEAIASIRSCTAAAFRLCFFPPEDCSSTLRPNQFKWFPLLVPLDCKEVAAYLLISSLLMWRDTFLRTFTSWGSGLSSATLSSSFILVSTLFLRKLCSSSHPLLMGINAVNQTRASFT